MRGLSRKRKVFAYVTSGDRLLVFDHAHHPEAGTQVPAGTLEPAEDPVAGALREAREETGLDQMVVVGVLGEAEIDMRPWGKRESHHRTFVHLRAEGPVPETWEHWEEHPDGGPGERYLFVLRWVTLDEANQVLIAGHGAFIDALRS